MNLIDKQNKFLEGNRDITALSEMAREVNDKLRVAEATGEDCGDLLIRSRALSRGRDALAKSLLEREGLLHVL